MQETMIKQSQESLENLPVLYKSDDSQSIKYNPTQEVIRLYSTLLEKDTVVVYQKAAEKTWDILKQAIVVIFFLFRLFIALIIWACGIAYQSGKHLRNWLMVNEPTLYEIMSALLNVLKQALSDAYKWAASFIKENLGLEIKFDSIPAQAPATKSQ